MREKVVKVAELVKSVGGAIAVTISLLGGGVGLIVWVYQLRAEVTANHALYQELKKQHESDEELLKMVDQLTRAIEKQTAEEPKK